MNNLTDLGKIKRAILLSSLFIIVMLVFLPFAYGGGGGASPDPKCTCCNPPVYGTNIYDWTIKGDSMAYGLAGQWGGVENDGMCGATIKSYSNYPDTRTLKNVVLFIGVNNFYGNPNYNLNQVLIDYATLFHSIKGNIYCVGIPKITHGYDPVIVDFNESIKSVCGADHYVDTWSMPFTSPDGVHPGGALNALIKAKILELNAAHP